MNSDFDLEYFFNEQSLNTPIPNNIKNLTFTHSFNHSIDDVELPESIRKITFGEYNQSLDNVKFPKLLREIIFIGKFNKSINKINFPKSLIKLSFSWNFNQPINENVLPKSLKVLELDINYSYSTEFLKNLPNLEILIIYNYNMSKINYFTENLPNNIKTLCLIELLSPVNNLPVDLQKIVFIRTKKDIIENSKIPYGCLVEIGN